jgi:hypothetical protein
MSENLFVIGVCWLLFAVVLVLAFGIGPDNGRNDLSCRGLFAVPVAIAVGAADEDKLDADGDGRGCEGSLRGGNLRGGD